MVDSAIESPNPLLLCKLQSGKFLVDALQSLPSAASLSSDLVLVVVPRNQNGLRFVVQESGYFQACVTLPRELFTLFECHPPADVVEDTAFQVPRTELLTCLQLFVGCTGPVDRSALGAPLRMLYQRRGSPLQLLLQIDPTSYLDCEVQTAAQVPLHDFEFLQVPIYNDAVIMSRVLAICLAELDYTGAAAAQLSMVPYPCPGLRMQALGDQTVSNVRVQIPFFGTGDDEPAEDVAFLEFECVQEQTVAYSALLLKRCLRALQRADLVRLRMNANDVLHMTARVPLPTGHGFRNSVNRKTNAVVEVALAASEGAFPASQHCFFEFLVAPLAFVPGAQPGASLAANEEDPHDMAAARECAPDLGAPGSNEALDVS
ncbi:similar to cell cycle checkpoint and DNA repair exonuclease RAD1 [Cyanidioschyzon merolae strain 10D]|uniref:Similar to cell cycle checkpoint and DNA repair exonuclease RAD1 n=1 Tax=Cyanidioschyzon merolae (strain NIES-3377 / 10D) TaxID=280699 RepID=M1VE73_CYAM1|nr:similar to cell cycle checkpoint and DNA repair exonuclease RAD1 [Cyanidioschyzon merolae strain 10D]BAM81187.1 similar to cell cycle checkpoint and DNA repair exonuclease RAD1 [Cyanidioschyzon merolae strain 10D]|eukprot:XP_005537223.1 similar to cell cycle checkpoint and DNA repair exonuclease RAD1 [Cyanidioschyzon merolae strain 10D]